MGVQATPNSVRSSLGLDIFCTHLLPSTIFLEHAGEVWSEGAGGILCVQNNHPNHQKKVTKTGSNRLKKICSHLMRSY